MKDNFKRLLSLFLLACILLGAVSCTGGVAEETTSPITDAITETPETEALGFKLTAEYKLVRPDESAAEEVKALQLLSRGIESACGIRLPMATDFTRKGAEVVPEKYEILIGATNRSDSVSARETLTYYDWTYKIVSENVIVICGGSPESTVTAVKSFLKDIFGYEEDEDGNVISKGSATELKCGVEFLYNNGYPITSLKLGEHEIGEYSIVDASKNGKGIEKLVQGISRVCGINLPVVPIADYKSGPAIFYGCGKSGGGNGEHEYFTNNRYFITESDGNIFIDFKNDSAGEVAAERFIFEYMPLGVSGEYKIELSNAREISGLRVSSGTNGLVPTDWISNEVAPGIVYTEIIYEDKDGAPVRAYAISVEKGSATIQTTMPSDSADKIGTVAKMSSQLSAAVSNGKNVLAGVNADFFDMGGTNVMRGLCIKDGKLISGTGGRPWFGITHEGDAVMGTEDDYAAYRNKLTTAVGASHVILKDGATDNLATSTEFSYTRHPRTAAGVTADGTVVLIVVDGRQPSISNGASLADLAYIMASLGCVNAVNLDGGGSSTFILKNEQGNLVTENSPSGGSLRSVANGLMVVLP